MFTAERIQALIHRLETGIGARWLNTLALALIVLALAVWYDLHCYRNFNSPEAMDAAQVARNLSEGNGFTTEFIRPFSIYLLQQHNHALVANQLSSTNMVDSAEVYGRHPDLANAPLYPVVLAGLWKITQPDWKIDLRKSFWSDGGRFVRYKPEFIIAVFNQILLLVAVWLTFLVAKILLDVPAARLAAVLMLCSETLWEYSVSGLPILLLLVIFLGLIWCLATFEASGCAENPDPRRRFMLALATGLLAGLGMLTHYSFGWVIVPVLVFFLLFGGVRRAMLAVSALLVFLVAVTPWLVRNYVVSGTLFGTAGYAVVEATMAFPGSHLMQSLAPNMSSAHWLMPYLIKLQTNLRDLLQNEVPRLGGGWIGILFLAGLLLGLRNVVARRLRYFTLMCLGLFLIVTALGRTQLSNLAGMNTENLLVLLTPLAVIFGVAFFLTLLNQMDLPGVPVRYAVIVLVILLVRLQFVLTLLPPKTQPSAFPYYIPPIIQECSDWVQPSELIMSDVPWAVAWYGDRQCTWTTLNCEYEFYQFHNHVKHVNALYLSLNTLDNKLFTECVAGGVDTWGKFGLDVMVYHQVPPSFPLVNPLPDSMSYGIFLADRKRW